MTQHELVKEYLLEFGKITPALMGGKVYKGVMFGSQTDKRCRELRAKGELVSQREGKFESYYFREQPKQQPIQSLQEYARQIREAKETNYQIF